MALLLRNVFSIFHTSYQLQPGTYSSGDFLDTTQISYNVSPKLWLITGSDVIIENTILMSFDIKFNRRDQKERRNDEAC